MTVWKAMVLGLVQGLTEFLPVSSSGHLLLFERLLGTDGGLYFSVMLHGGTLIAVLFAYAPRLLQMWKRERKTLGLLLFATLPAAAVGFFFGDAVDEAFFGGEYLWAAFLLTALLLALCELRRRSRPAVRPLNARRALAVGAAQALAVLPGLSRSGVTLAAGIGCGLSREDAADFSFLLSIPIIAGAIFASLLHLPQGSGAISWQCLAAGGLVAALGGSVAVRWMLAAVRRHSLMPFAVYLFALSALLVCLRFCGIFA